MKKGILLIAIVFLLIGIGNMLFSIGSLWSKKDLLTQTQERLRKEQQEHVRLQRDEQTVTTNSFIEEQARDKLFLGKPGESIVLIPTASPSAGPVRNEPSSLPVWRTWWNLFF